MIGPAVSSTHASGTVDVHLIPTPCVSGTMMHPGGLAFFLLLEHGVRHYQFELRAQSHYKLAIGVAFPNPMFAHVQVTLLIVSSFIVGAYTLIIVARLFLLCYLVAVAFLSG